MFKHALTHDVAYESVLRERRRRAAPHHRARHRGAVRRSPRRALRDARAPLRSRRGLAARARLPRARGGEGGRQLRQSRRRRALPRGARHRGAPRRGRGRRAPRRARGAGGAGVLLRSASSTRRGKRTPGRRNAAPIRAPAPSCSACRGSATSGATATSAPTPRSRPRSTSRDATTRPRARRWRTSNAGFFRGVCQGDIAGEAAAIGAGGRARGPRR